MKTRPLIATMATVLLSGCVVLPHPNCAPLQQAERRNSKDLDAYCYTEATQDALKCAKAKDERDHLRELRARIDKETSDTIPGRGPHDTYEKCAL